MQIITAADMGRTDENLRHGHAAMGAFHHALAQFGAAADVDFGERHALPRQQCLGADAIGTIARGIDFHRRHDKARKRYLCPRYMGVRSESTTPAKTSASALTAPARRRARAQASIVAPDVSTSSTRIRWRPATSPFRSGGTRKAPWTLLARSVFDKPTCCAVALTRLSAA